MLARLGKNVIRPSLFSVTARNLAFQPAPQEISKHVPSSLNPFESLLRVVVGVPLSPFGFYTVQKNHVAVVEYFGKYYDTKVEGLRFNLPFGCKY